MHEEWPSDEERKSEFSALMKNGTIEELRAALFRVWSDAETMLEEGNAGDCIYGECGSRIQLEIMDWHNADKWKLIRVRR